MSFPIIGWAQMPKEQTRPEVFANIARCGVNVFMTCADSPKDVLAQLDLAAEYGLQALVVDPRFSATDKPGWEDRARAAMDEYGDHPATFGFSLRDEPVRSEFEREARMMALVQAERPDKVAYINGLGWGCRGADSFMEYVEEYARIIKPSMLSFDAYPISTIPGDAETSAVYKADRGVEWPELNAYYRDRYWEAWETYRLVGWKYNIPLWGFVLATPHQHSIWFYGPVTEGTLRLEAFTGLAHGIQALQYFTLPSLVDQYEGAFNGWDDGILGRDGEPSIRFEAFRRVNRDVATLGPIVKDLTCSRVFHTGPLTSNCCRWNTVRGPRDSSHLGIARIDGDPVIIGFLKGDGKRYMMIVNRNPARRGRVVVEMQNGWKALEVYKRDGKTETPLQSSFHVGLEPGDGRLFRFEETVE
jgi:hypothetical protein